MHPQPITQDHALPIETQQLKFEKIYLVGRKAYKLAEGKLRGTKAIEPITFTTCMDNEMPVPTLVASGSIKSPADNLS